MRVNYREFVWSERARRPRAPWRLLTTVGCLLLAAIVATALVEALLSIVHASGLAPRFAGGFDHVWADLALLASHVVVLGVVGFAARYVDRRRLRDLGLHIDTEWWADLAFGLALGGVLMTTIFLGELALGWLSVTELPILTSGSVSFWLSMASGLALWIVVGFAEELFVRGYLLTNLAEGCTWFDRVDERRAVVLATLATALVFALLHAVNPGASMASAVGIFAAGLMLATGYVVTGELAIPVGIHVSWNLFQGTIYGFPVSGIDRFASAVRLRQHGPALVTGGEFGPEAGLAGMIAILAGIGLILAWVVRRRGTVRSASSITTLDRSGDSNAHRRGE